MDIAAEHQSKWGVCQEGEPVASQHHVLVGWGIMRPEGRDSMACSSGLHGYSFSLH